MKRLSNPATTIKNHLIDFRLAHGDTQAQAENYALNFLVTIFDRMALTNRGVNDILQMRVKTIENHLTHVRTGKKERV